jgi:ribosomal 50S subunit-recycling heat shock protein
MRLDQYLQKVGIVKRRSIAKTLCDNGAVTVNGRRAKPAVIVAADDLLSVRLRARTTTYKILQVPGGSVKKEERGEYVELLSEEKIKDELF